MRCNNAGRLLLAAACCFFWSAGQAQTDLDALTMNKKQLCVGFQYSHNSWDHYWEGTLKRTNENIGTITTQSVALMGNYGISNKVNLLFAVPYVFTKASAGTLQGQKGFQDGTLAAKWNAFQHKGEKQAFSLFALAGVSAPLSNYTPDFLPMSIGLHSRAAFVRGLADYQRGKFFITGSASYHLRNNVDIARTAYYTTEMHYTNEVEMPDMWYANLRTGYRGRQLIVEATADRTTTLGGFDIRRNDMPFPSNRMNLTNVGLSLRYEPGWLKWVTLTAGGTHAVAGRNMGQATAYYAGAFYIFNFGKKAAVTKTSQTP
ncbi:hypothetical protein [Paracnuella aquatica]|uniref:hypothetical protein n=1 Tax=Paracnuella aquatica TaxID=2268757 RepID=UPI0019D48507|nr:hypothetical protein [Paracnuella aquatica]